MGELVYRPLVGLAYMEMYMAIGYLIRRFDFQLPGTTEADMAWDEMAVLEFYGQLLVVISTARRLTGWLGSRIDPCIISR
jgi:hypothetical protein